MSVTEIWEVRIRPNPYSFAHSSLTRLKLLRLWSLYPRKCAQFIVHVETYPPISSPLLSIFSPWNVFCFLLLKTYINFLGPSSNSTSYLGPILSPQSDMGSSFESQHFFVILLHYLPSIFSLQWFVFCLFFAIKSYSLCLYLSMMVHIIDHPQTFV